MSQLRSTSLGMFEGAVLLCGLLGIRADAQFKWRDQCSNMLAAADGRANAASAAASIDFKTSAHATATLKKLGEDMCGDGVICWLVPGKSRHGVGKGQDNLFNMGLFANTEHLPQELWLLGEPGVHVVIVCAVGPASTDMQRAKEGCYEAMMAKGSYGSKKECGCPVVSTQKVGSRVKHVLSQRVAITAAAIVPTICLPTHTVFEDALSKPVIYPLSAAEKLRLDEGAAAIAALGSMGTGKVASAGLDYMRSCHQCARF